MVFEYDVGVMVDLQGPGHGLVSERFIAKLLGDSSDLTKVHLQSIDEVLVLVDSSEVMVSQC